MSVKLHNPSSQTAGLVNRILSAIDTPRALTCWMLYQYGEHEQLVNLECDPLRYGCGSSFALDYQATKLLSKANFLVGLPSPREKAIQKFRESEDACRATNRRLVNPGAVRPYGFDSIFHAAIRYIASVLGEVPYDSIIESCGWGPGVSSSCKGQRTTGYDKFTSVPEVTPDLQLVVHHVINAWHPWSATILQAQDEETGLPLPCSLIPYGLPTVRGNKVAFVPKNSKTDRAIAVEPTVNCFVQKGIGSVIRRKLRRAGVDLSDQGRNRALARRGSVDGSLCTIDLESASDTISLELVRRLLPPAWFDLLDRARSKFGTFDGKTFFWEKFSSMGNGFTFELESLIFWALTRAIADEASSDEPVSVYGDDIICESRLFGRVSEIFAHCGFKVNVLKSFSHGPFRESCGEDFYRNLNVRPFFFKEEPTTPFEWLVIANALRVHSTRQTEGMFSDRMYRDAWRYCISQIPRKLRFFGPMNANGVIWIHESEKTFCTWNGSVHRVRCHDVVSKRSAGYVVGGLLLAAWLYAKDSPLYGRFTHRQQWVTRVRHHSFPEWLSIGAWG